MAIAKNHVSRIQYVSECQRKVVIPLIFPCFITSTKCQNIRPKYAWLTVLLTYIYREVFGHKHCRRKNLRTFTIFLATEQLIIYVAVVTFCGYL
jgi:hypothetical protein